MAFPDLLTAFEISPQIETVVKEFREEGIKGICYVGMGGSSIAGNYTKFLLQETSKKQFQIVRDYSLPNYIDDGWLIIITSYSGNTEETISSLRDAMDKNLRNICITSDGEIEKIGKNVVKIPGNIQPRAAFPLLFSAAYSLTELSLGEKPTDFYEVSKFLKERAQAWGEERSKPLDVAAKFQHKIPVFIGSGYLVPVAYRAKCQMNENAKHPAFFAEIPEANHNEIEAFGEPTADIILPVFLRGNHEKSEILKRIDVTYELYKDWGIESILVNADHGGHLEQMLALTHYLDTVSVDLAKLDKVNPVSVERISELKQRLAQQS